MSKKNSTFAPLTLCVEGAGDGRIRALSGRPTPNGIIKESRK